jgi:hypothetical protein
VNIIYGLFSAPASAQRAYAALRSAGVARNSIVVMSPEPFEEWEFMEQDKHSRMSWIAVIGAFVGLTTAYLLTSLTQQAWPINTGGMPTVTNWTNIIIMFELTMLGAVLATVITLLRTARLPAKLPACYDSSVSEGKIVIGAADDGKLQLDAVERALRNAGADQIEIKPA